MPVQDKEKALSNVIVLINCYHYSILQSAKITTADFRNVLLIIVFNDKFLYSHIYNLL